MIKAGEMETRSADPMNQVVSGEYRAMAREWRKLAMRAETDAGLEASLGIQS